jgi:hypothetical protein
MSEQQKDATLIFMDGLEAIITEYRKNVGAKTQTAPQKTVESFDPDKIRWESHEGPNGWYERTDDVNNPEYKKMLALMQTAGGNLSKAGKFYWTFQNGAMVGRKDRTRKETTP